MRRLERLLYLSEWHFAAVIAELALAAAALFKLGDHLRRTA